MTPEEKQIMELRVALIGAGLDPGGVSDEELARRVKALGKELLTSSAILFKAFVVLANGFAEVVDGMPRLSESEVKLDDKTK